MAPRKLPIRPIGKQGLQASAQGLGAMSLAGVYGDPKQPVGEDEYQTLLDTALELGDTFIDSADIYGKGKSEQVIAKALARHGREAYVVATKFGNVFEGGINGKPDYVRQCVEDSLQRLGTDHIDLYYQHRVDRTIPMEDTWNELKKLVEEGKVRFLGISEASPAEIRAAHAVHPISAVQLEWSLWTRDAEAEVIPLCRELGIGIVAYSPIGRGVLSGRIADLASLPENDRRKALPRLAGDNWKHNVEILAKLNEMADKKSVTPAQLALAWVHAQGEDVFPIPGTQRTKYLEQNVEAFFMDLSKEEVAYLSDVFAPGKVKGDRHSEGYIKNGYEAGKKA